MNTTTTTALTAEEVLAALYNQPMNGRRIWGIPTILGANADGYTHVRAETIDGELDEELFVRRRSTGTFQIIDALDY